MKARKHQLLATSALATAAMALPGVAAAEMMKPAISVGGYFFHDTHFASQDDDANKGSIAHHIDAEVHFKMSGELDNGLKIGGRIELEGLTQTAHKGTKVVGSDGKEKTVKPGGDDIDEASLDVSGAWGMLRLGMTNSGRYGHSWSVTGPNVAQSVTSGVQTEWLAFPGGTSSFGFRRPLGSAHPDVSNDDPAVTYFTPRFNGFQLALTHRPTVQNSGGRNVGFADETEDYTDALDASVQYSGDVGGMKVALVLGGATADAPANDKNHDDYQIVNGGAKVSTGGFSFGGHMADVEDEMNKGTGKVYVVGASYGQGPWAVSTTYHNGEVSHTTPPPPGMDIITHDPKEGNDHKVTLPEPGKNYADHPATAEMSVWAVGARYTLGPGVSLLASYQNAEVTVDSQNAAADKSNEGSAFSVGLAVRF